MVSKRPPNGSEVYDTIPKDDAERSLKFEHLRRLRVSGRTKQTRHKLFSASSHKNRDKVL